MAKKVASRHVKTKRSQGEADEIKELERGLVVLDPAVAAGDGASAQTRGGVICYMHHSYTNRQPC